MKRGRSRERDARAVWVLWPPSAARQVTLVTTMMKLESLFSWLLTSAGDKAERMLFGRQKTSLRALLHRMRTQARSCEPQQADGLTTLQKLVVLAHFTTMFT